MPQKVVVCAKAIYKGAAYEKYSHHRKSSIYNEYKHVNTRSLPSIMKLEVITDTEMPVACQHQLKMLRNYRYLTFIIHASIEVSGS